MWEREEHLARGLGYSNPVGVDESGRGPLAGPVVAAAVYLPENINIKGVNDCKLLTVKERKRLFFLIMETPGVHVGIGRASRQEIDSLNILQASLLAMLRAVSALPIKADYLLIDGNKMPKTHIPGKAIVKGDSKVESIAAASVVAKYTRDQIMFELDQKYPEYGFASHKGYGTAAHLKALREFGPTEEHRLSFAPVRDSMLLSNGAIC